MSAYRKFIDSATKVRQHQVAPSSPPSDMSQLALGASLVSSPAEQLSGHAKPTRLGHVQQQQHCHHQGPACATKTNAMSASQLEAPKSRVLINETARFHHHQQQQQDTHWPTTGSCCLNLGHHQNGAGQPTGSSYHQYQAGRAANAPMSCQQLRLNASSLFDCEDPVLRNWLQAMRFETELECLTALQARTLAIDEHSAGALSVRNSQVSIQEIRLESQLNLEFIDYLIDSLPLCSGAKLDKFALDFSELWARLVDQTRAQLAGLAASAASGHRCNPAAPSNNYLVQRPAVEQRRQQLTIINCTPRKSLVGARTARPLDKLADQIRTTCLDLAKDLHQAQLSPFDPDHQTGAAPGWWSDPQARVQAGAIQLDSGQLEAQLRRLKELYGKFVEISLRAECANIVRALEFDFSQSSLGRLSSSSSLQPVRPFESCSAQLPLKWALIALWQLTKDDSYICRTLTEKWQTVDHQAQRRPQQAADCDPRHPECENTRPRVAKRLDYSTKYDHSVQRQAANNGNQIGGKPHAEHNLRSDYEKLYQICQNDLEFKRKQQSLGDSGQQTRRGALSSALKCNQERPIRQMSTIELLIDIIISQPNKHERLDMMSLVHSKANDCRLIDVDELDQSVSAAIYTSNQYKVAALRILNHLCVNEQAVKTILKCFSTPPANPGQVLPENKIIRSVFECYQTGQEQHIYQNETILQASKHQANKPNGLGYGKRSCGSSAGGPAPVVSAEGASYHQLTHCEPMNPQQDEEFSDYGSRLTGGSQPTTRSAASSDLKTSTRQQAVASGELDQSDDAVVKEAIRLLIQLTAYFHRSNQGHDYYTLIGRFSIEALVRYLSNIIRSTASREMLFLSLSALANISFITTEPMRIHSTNGIILQMFRASRDRARDLELRDQAVTILANTADKNLPDLVNNGGLGFLLACLESCPTRMANFRQLGGQSATGTLKSEQQIYANQQTLAQNSADSLDNTALGDGAYGRPMVAGHTQGARPVSGKTGGFLEKKPRDRKPVALGDEFLDDLDCACDQTTASGQRAPQGNPIGLCLSKLGANELAALERIHQKSAVAFARMAADLSTAQLVADYGGLKQLIDLCKISHKRNHSDTVLIACIAALRKMAKVIDRELFRHYNALDLIDVDVSYTLNIYGNIQGVVKQPQQQQQQRQQHLSAPAYGQLDARLFASDV